MVPAACRGMVIWQCGSSEPAGNSGLRGSVRGPSFASSHFCSHSNRHEAHSRCLGKTVSLNFQKTFGNLFFCVNSPPRGLCVALTSPASGLTSPASPRPAVTALNVQLPQSTAASLAPVRQSRGWHTPLPLARFLCPLSSTSNYSLFRSPKSLFCFPTLALGVSSGCSAS